MSAPWVLDALLQAPLLHPMLLGIEWMDPNWLLERFGAALFWISLAIVFVECGLFFPILPGDSLLFALVERDGRIIKRKYFDQTTAFFDHHGNKALVIGRFVPFVRTYITVVAGVTRMERHRFFVWSFVGAVLWVLSVCLLGFFLGDAFPALGESIDKLIIVIVAFSLIPIAIEWWRHRRTNAPGAEVGPHDGGPDRDITGRDLP